MKMRFLLVLSTVFVVAVADIPNLLCDQLSWSVPTSTQGECFSDGRYPNPDNWFCDWGINSGHYYDVFNCNSYPSSPYYYSSYLGRMPSAMQSMVHHTTDMMNKCNSNSRLTSSSWGDIPFMCPDPQSSFHHNIPYSGETMLPLSQSSCQNIQRIFCEAVFPMSTRTITVSSAFSSPSYSSSSHPSKMEMIPHFLAHYDYNSAHMYSNPNGEKTNLLSSSFLNEFVSEVNNCQKDFWRSVVKFDCSIVKQMLNALGYPQRGHKWDTSYTSAYERYRSRNLKENCQLLVKHIYTGFLDMINRNVEYVAPTDGGCPSGTPTTSNPSPGSGGQNKPLGSQDKGNDDGLSEWVIVVLSTLGILAFLGFCALLFALIYKMYTHKSVAPVRYQVENGGRAIVGEAGAAGGQPMSPPAYQSKEKIVIE